jgi:hypothetical protein
VAASATANFTAQNPAVTTLKIHTLGNLTVTGSMNLIGPGTNVDPQANHASRQLLIVNNTLSVPGKLDLAGNDMIVRGGDVNAVTARLASAIDGGAWDGASGITSSLAAADYSSLQLTALGVSSADDYTLYSETGATTFDGQAINSGDVLVKFTYYGDANLDGTVDPIDYSSIDNGYAFNLTGWSNGDFNYDGVVDPLDYSLIDNAYAFESAGGLAAQEMIAKHSAEFGAAYVYDLSRLQAGQPVPEPTALGVLAIASLGLLSKRRRKA